jgi:hypothetical protein
MAALEHFLASNRLVANGNVEFNIARTYERLLRYPDAYRWYVRALERENDPTTREHIETALRAMSPNVAVLRVETDPPGAKVFLDRKDLGERGSTPQRLGLAPGRYTVIVELPGYEDARSAPTDVRLGEDTRVTLKLVRILGTVRVAGAPARDPRRQRGRTARVHRAVRRRGRPGSPHALRVAARRSDGDAARRRRAARGGHGASPARAADGYGGRRRRRA